MGRRYILLVGLCAAALAGAARADSFTGADWQAHFNLPDQNTFTSTVRADEYLLRERFAISHVTVQIESSECIDPEPDCGEDEHAGGHAHTG